MPKIRRACAVHRHELFEREMVNQRQQFFMRKIANMRPYTDNDNNKFRFHN